MNFKSPTLKMSEMSSSTSSKNMSTKDALKKQRAEILQLRIMLKEKTPSSLSGVEEMYLDQLENQYWEVTKAYKAEKKRLKRLV